jgi:dihydroflavonol-4-reductase
LRACVQDDSKVKRVVLTSSQLAITGDFFRDGYTYTENDWPDIKDQIPYTKSKIMAERAAWDFVKDRKEKNKKCPELTVINPGYVIVRNLIFLMRKF